jgi:hypothetical protein
VNEQTPTPLEDFEELGRQFSKLLLGEFGVPQPQSKRSKLQKFVANAVSLAVCAAILFGLGIACYELFKVVS